MLPGGTSVVDIGPACLACVSLPVIRDNVSGCDADLARDALPAGTSVADIGSPCITDVSLSDIQDNVST
jgi:hypothetical protein